MKANKMAAVREVLSTNPDASPVEIVEILAKKDIEISVGVASNYKSVIKSGGKSGRKKKRKSKKQAEASSTPQKAVSTNGTVSHGLEPAVVELLKVGKSLGWKKVQSIVELMSDLK
jgi:hypothetical protein